MEYFCLIYPDAVFNGTAGKILEQILRANVKLVDRVVRKLTFEEARTIFYARRFNKDFERFCKAMTYSPVWLICFSYEDDLAEALSTSIHPDLVGEFFIPTTIEDNENFVRLIGDVKHSKEQLSKVIANLREQINQRDHKDDLYFTAQAMRQGRRLYSYFTAMRVNGFDSNQAFELTRGVQQFLFERELEESFSEEDDDEDDEYDDDDTGIDDEDDPTDAHDGNGD